MARSSMPRARKLMFRAPSSAISTQRQPPKEGETVILSWTEWPSKDARDDLLPRVLADPRVQPEDGEKAVFEGARLVAGGFAKLLDT